MCQNEIKSFKRGWEKLNDLEKKRMLEELKYLLALSSDSAVYARIRGSIACSPAEYNEIEIAFNDMGVTDIWGGAKENIKKYKLDKN